MIYALISATSRIGDYGFAWAAYTQLYTCTHVAYGIHISVGDVHSLFDDVH